MENNFQILVLFYSLSGHTAKLAECIAQGAQEIAGAQVEVKQVPELVSPQTFDNDPNLQKVRASFAQVPVATVDDLISADGVAFGTPVHFGSFASQMKQFIDQLSPVFVKGSLVGKPAALFTSAGSIHGGEEVALLSLMIPLLNLGMIPIGVPYPIQGEGADFDAGSPYGAIWVSGHKGDKKLAESDIKVAKILGRRLSAMAKIIKFGTANFPDCQFLANKYD